MKLKSLEVHGFKSFAEKTLIEFTGGVTAIVGPNGCGKSNVVDAVKWVLGEQSVKSLRGREMADVIFNGSERRPAMNMAEATLVFDNEDRTLDIDQSEVSISRILYRSGESDYQINKKSCRLRDIRELLMGTGLGPGGYSFMEQGKIDSVLASNPMERRKVFEEAAGISRFRARRHETELKLEKVDANLLRLADIIDELERRERSLKIQAGKAQRYREASERARELQARVAIHRFRENKKARAEIEAQLEGLRLRRDELAESRDSQREAFDAINEQLAAANEKLSLAREQAADLRAREKGAREMSEFHRRHLDDLASRSQNRQSEIEELERDLEVSATERSEQEKERAALEASVEEKRRQVEAAAAEVEGLRVAARDSERVIREAGAELDSLVRRRTELERESARREADERRWRDESARATERLDELQREQARVEEEIRSAKASSESVHASLGERRAALAAAESELESFEEEVRHREEARNEAISERSRLQSRRDILEGHIARNEGLNGGVSRLLDAQGKDSSFLSGCQGLLLDLIAVERGQADAIEAALGEASQALVVETVEEALAGARFLVENGGGRAAFLPLELFGSSDAGGGLPKGVSLRPGAELSAENRRRVEGLLAELIGGVSIYELDDAARRLQAGESLPSLVVTERGDLVRGGRLFILGGQSGETGLLALRSEFEELSARTEEVERHAQDAERAHREGIEEREAMVVSVKALRTEARDEESRAHAISHELRGVQATAERLEAEKSRLDGQLALSAEKLSALDQAREASMSGFAELEGLLSGAAKMREQTESQRETSREQLEEASRKLELQRVELASDEQRFQGLASSVSHLADRHERALRAIERYRDELTSFAGDRERSDQLAREEAAKAESLKIEVETIAETISKEEEAVAEVRSRHEIVGREIRQVEKAFEGASDEFHQADVRANELRVSQENLIAHVREELEVELEELEAREEFAEVVPEEGSEDVISEDWSSVEDELNELRDRLRKLGNVNLAAIDDLEEVQERLEFLVAQRNDLTHSKQQLSRILGNIEEESTRLFRETFDKVRSEFQVTFRKLFGGGKADIVLTDPENVLESGIEITARPPGKEMRSIELLSGGERTLTAVSLLFSIIRAHPCPCCLMDEVDAALDEDNTERFGMLLNEFFDRTQFILITHSRRTMARADVLFGVTMGERGVSRPVAVRFEDVDEHGNISETKASAKPKKAAKADKPKDGASPGGESGNGHSKGAGNGHHQGRSLDESGAPGGEPEASIGNEILVEVSEAAEEDGGGRVGPISDLAERERRVRTASEPAPSGEEERDAEA